MAALGLIGAVGALYPVQFDLYDNSGCTGEPVLEHGTIGPRVVPGESSTERCYCAKGVCVSAGCVQALADLPQLNWAPFSTTATIGGTGRGAAPRHRALCSTTASSACNATYNLYEADANFVGPLHSLHQRLLTTRRAELQARLSPGFQR